MRRFVAEVETGVVSERALDHTGFDESHTGVKGAEGRGDETAESCSGVVEVEAQLKRQEERCRCACLTHCQLVAHTLMGTPGERGGNEREGAVAPIHQSKQDAHATGNPDWVRAGSSPEGVEPSKARDDVQAKVLEGLGS